MKSWTGKCERLNSDNSTSNLLKGVPKLRRWTLTITFTEKVSDIVHLVLIITQLWDFSTNVLGMEE